MNLSRPAATDWSRMFAAWVPYPCKGALTKAQTVAIFRAAGLV